MVNDNLVILYLLKLYFTLYQSPFLNDINDFMLARQYSKRTIKTYIAWICAYINFHNKQHPGDMGKPEVAAFLTYLAVERTVSARTKI